VSVRARRESSGEPSSILKYHSAPDVCRLVAVTPTSPRSHSLLIDSALWVSDYLPDSTYNLTFILLFVYYDRFNPPSCATLPSSQAGMISFYCPLLTRHRFLVLFV
jgi:hypothetical protein